MTWHWHTSEHSPGTSRRPAGFLVTPGSLAAFATAALLSGCSSTAQLHAARVRTLELHSDNNVIVIAHSPRELGIRDADLERWVWDAATAVQIYYGRFPVQRLTVDVEPAHGLGPQTRRRFRLRLAADPHERRARQRRRRVGNGLDVDP